MLLDIQGDMRAMKNTKKQMDKLLNNDEILDKFLEKSKKLNKAMKEDYQDYLSKNKEKIEMTDKEKLETIKELVINYDMGRYGKDNFINKVMLVI